MIRHILISFIFITLLACGASAQFPGGVSHHPGLDWKVAETENFRIIYPERLSGIEAEAAPIAEETYTVLSELLGVEIPVKIRIYLTDEDEITNGFAAPIGYGFTKIWVNTNEALDSWSGDVKWLRKVLAHELAHIFHFNAVRSRINPLDYPLSNPVPSFWAEGLAQYLTESWDAFRGEKWLRTAVLENRISHTDNRSIRNGRLMYAYGNSVVRRFTELYGDSTLAELLRHRTDLFPGVVKTHNFYLAFKETTGQSYAEFRNDWEKHIRIHYHSVAGKMERTDSLASAPVPFPGTYILAQAQNPQAKHTATLAIHSVGRPFRILTIANDSTGKETVFEGGFIQDHLSWNADGTKLAYSRRITGENRAMLFDLYEYDISSGKTRRLTHSRRARFPVWLSDGRLLFTATELGTTNLFILDPESGKEEQITRFKGDVQLSWPSLSPEEDRVAISLFDHTGSREIGIVNLSNGNFTRFTSGDVDDRRPFWSPDGSQIAWTSLRDDVPNIFIRPVDDVAAPETRLTNVFTGAELLGWRQTEDGDVKLMASSTESKQRDFLWEISPDREPWTEPVDTPERYASWTNRTPEKEISPVIYPDASLITLRSDYSSWNEITHLASLPFPWYIGPNDWGPGLFTAWMEPLGKHTIFATGGYSIPDYNNSFFLVSYVNRQLHPEFFLNIYRRNFGGQFYDNGFLLNINTGAEAGAVIPLDIFDRPFRYASLMLKLSVFNTEPSSVLELETNTLGMPEPVVGRQTNLMLSFTMSEKRNFAGSRIHPLQGWGVRARLTGSARVLYSDTRFIKPEITAYHIFPAPGRHRIFLYGRAIAILGDDFPQNFIGLSRFDDISIDLPFEGGTFFNPESERVRGYRAYTLGDRFVFSTLEYRTPFLPGLETTILGLISLDETTLALFGDAGFVWNSGTMDGNGYAYERQIGTGVELKNLLRFGPLQIVHSVGIAQPVDALFERDYDLYYRVRATVPF